MPEQHTVEEGECLNSIAEQHGFFVEYLWEHPVNVDLRALRGSMNTLVPGDIVNIPDLREKTVQIGTGRTWRYRRRGIPAQIRLQFFHENEPRAHEDWEFEVEGLDKQTGHTDAEGALLVFVPPQAMSGKLTIGPDRQVYELDFGKLQPVDQIAGAQARLNNLGYDCGEVTGEMNDETKEALEIFQRAHGLDDTGELDEPTQQQLAEIHDHVNEEA